MKLVTTLVILSISFTNLAQTKIIALKRHSANVSQINDYKNHNFGNPPMPEIQSIQYLKENCIVKKGNDYRGNPFCDTICNISYLEGYKLTTKEIKEFLPFWDKNAKLIDFDKYEKERKEYLRANREQKQNGLPFLVVLIAFASLRMSTSKN